jgi:thymidine phosphorylase
MTARWTLTESNAFGEMNFLSFIEQKCEGKILAPEQIQEFIREFTAGKIPDYQMAAMLMAIYFRVRRFSPRF